jgi:protein-L-isoaspartate(D-aspartate) O-methyltransferase
MAMNADDERLADFRKVYADVVMARAGCRDDRLLAAFEKIPRHRFIGPGPWRLAEHGSPTRSVDPALLYQDIALGLAPERGITTGLPSLHARCIEACALGEGERVVHVGAGAGYYTAILAELVGPTGAVDACEIDEELATRARGLLAQITHVQVHSSIGTRLPRRDLDLIYVCAAVEQLPREWLDALGVGGRLAVPLAPADAEGGFLLVRRDASRLWTARFLCAARFVPCVGAQDAEIRPRLRAAFRSGGMETVRSLRRAPEEPDGSCWLAGADWWLSTDAPVR